MTSTALFVALFGILACFADAQLRQSANLLSKESRDLKTLKTYGSNPSFKLGKCEGDCDKDSDCLDQLICFQKNSGGSGKVPGCSGTDSTRTDFCIDPADVGAPTGSPPTSPTAPAPTSSGATLRSYGRSPPSSRFPLGLCEGDCDSDSDCASGLRCLQRGSNAGSVPGCSGSDSTSTDYCVASNSSPSAPGPSPTAPAPTSSSGSENFKLKMYWEEGYFWQEETFERKWCMRCRGGSCDVGNRLHIENCSMDGVQRFDFVTISNGQVQIKLHGTNLCLERTDYDIFINNCDSGDAMQLFFAKRGGFGEYRFEISPVTASDLCVTNDTHHPKSDETVHLEPCWLPRSSDTSYWERCYDNSC